MVSLYRFFQSHKWLLYTTLILTTVIFCVIGVRCRFEENIAKLLPPTDSSLNIDLAFSDLKVKDKLFVQVVPKQGAVLEEEERDDYLIGALDMFMQTVSRNDKDSTVLSMFYEVDPELILETLDWVRTVAPAYLDFTDEQMDSLTSFEHIDRQVAAYLDFLDTDMGQNLYDFVALDPCGIVLSQLPFDLTERTETGSSAFRQNHLFAGNSCFGFISPNLSSMDSGTAGKLLKNIKNAVKEVKTAYPEVDIYYHGAVVQSANNAGRIKEDLGMTIGISLIVILLLLTLCLRETGDTVLLMLPIIYGALFALAGMYVLQGGMSLMALGIGAIVLGVALSYCLHVMVHYKYVGNVEQTISEQAKPVFLGSLTTIGAFAGLIFTQSALLRDFGWFASFTMVGTTIGSLVFMPHFFRKNSRRNERAFRLLERANAYEMDRRPWIMVLVVLYVAVTIAFSGKYKFDSDLHNINYTAPEALEAQRVWAEHHNHGYFQQYYAAYGKTLDEALVNLETVEQTVDSLKAAGMVGRYTATSLFMPSEGKQQKRINHWKEYFSPDVVEQVWDRVEAACLHHGIDAEMFEPFHELMTENYFPELLPEAGVVPDGIMSNLTEKVGDYYLVFLPVKLHHADLKQVNGVLTKMEGCLVLDPFYYTADLVELIHSDFNKILLISSIFVFVVLLISFRRILLALIAFLPMFLSWYVVLGAMALADQSFNLINIVVSSFIFGIGVDYSIFIMDGLVAKAKGKNTQLLTYHKTAITISATILTICMASLLFAVHPAIKSIGFASLVGMITTIVLSYTIEPWLFRQLLKVDALRRHLIG